MGALGRLASSRPRRVLAATAACFLVAVVFGARAPGLLRGGHDFEDPGSEAALLRGKLEQATGRGIEPGLIALVTARMRRYRATVAVIALLETGVLEAVGVLMAIEHAAMFVAMFLVMIARPQEYAHNAHSGDAGAAPDAAVP